MDIEDGRLIELLLDRNEPESLVLRELVRDPAILNDTLTVRQALSIAVSRGRINSLRILLEAGFSPNTKSDSAGGIVLHTASLLEDDTEIVRELLKYGADVNAEDKRKITPLHEASRLKCLENMQVLLLNGAMVNAVNADGRTPLHLSLTPMKYPFVSPPYVSIVEVLLKADADVNISDAEGWAPLHYAVKYRLPQVVRLLLRHKADVNVRNDCGNTPLHYTVVAKQSELIRDLVENGAILDSVNNHGHSPLYCAIDARDVEATQELLRCGASFDIVACLESLDGSTSERRRPLYKITAIARELIRYMFIKNPDSLASIHQQLMQEKVGNILFSISSRRCNLKDFLQTCLSEVEALSKVVCDCGESSIWGSINNWEGCFCDTHQTILKFLFSSRKSNFTDAFFYKLSKEFILEVDLNLISYFEFKKLKKRVMLNEHCMKETERYVSFEDAVSFVQSKQSVMDTSEFEKYLAFLNGEPSVKSSNEISPPAPKKIRIS